jgi:hypothetical protein
MVEQWVYTNCTEINIWDKCSAAFLAEYFLLGKALKPMPFLEEFQVLRKQQRNIFSRLGKGFKSTSWPVLTMRWTIYLFFRISITGYSNSSRTY